MYSRWRTYTSIRNLGRYEMGSKKSNNYKKTKKNGIENVLYKLMYNVQQTRVDCTLHM